MAKIITLFNHKGGVSKTTTTFHLGWKMAQMGKRVLIVDADPQCNLTGLTLGIEDYDSLFKFYDSRQNSNIYESVRPVFEGEQIEAKAVEITETKQKNLFILAGHINLSEADIQIATAITSSENIPVLKNFVGVFYNLFDKTAKKNDIDVVLIDMSPSVSAMNMCLLMGADYFIIPTSPDFYCYQAIDSLSKVFEIWSERMKDFKDGFRLPKENPKLLGVISQNYRVYTQGKNLERTMTKSFEEWSQKIKKITNGKLVESLKKHNMVIDKEVFEKNVDSDKPYNLANIQDFNSLMPISQNHAKPIYEITREETSDWTGVVWDTAEDNIKRANTIYTNLAESVLKMIQ